MSHLYLLKLLSYNMLQIIAYMGLDGFRKVKGEYCACMKKCHVNVRKAYFFEIFNVYNCTKLLPHSVDTKF